MERNVCNDYEKKKLFLDVAEHEFNFRDFLFPSFLYTIKLMLFSWL